MWMNRSLIVVLLLLAAAVAPAQNLFSYGKQQVSKAEFLEAFNKNNTIQPPTAKAYQDYLELYVRYKLKVRAAYDLKLDTLANQKKELEEFRGQVMPQYLSDDSSLSALVNEAMENCSKDIHLLHIYIPYKNNDTAAAFAKATEALAKLKSGTSFTNVATEFSADPQVSVNKGDIGWISCFVLPYPLEKLAYGTPLQHNSGLYRSKEAYHIFYPAESRAAKGSLQVAQILLKVPAGAEAAAVAKVSKKADSLYQLLEKGADFAELAKNNSEDFSSYQSSGVMNAFAPGTYDPVFEEHAFALSADNETGKPFRGPDGFHILKRMTVYRFSQSQGKDAAFEAMKSRVGSDARIQIATDAALNKARLLTRFQETNIPTATVDRYTSGFINNDQQAKNSLPAATVLATTPSRKLTAKDYGDWLINNGLGLARAQPAFDNKAIYRKYLDETVMQEYQLHLEDYNPAFAKQLREFKDGNLIFEAMQIVIWDKAINDEAGLQRYYAAHPNKYQWKESLSGVLFTATDSLVAGRFRATLLENPGKWRYLHQPYETAVTADSGRFEFDQLPFAADNQLKPGTITSPAFDRETLTHSFVYLTAIHPANQPKTYSEARGLVINDYQQQLEENWVQNLRKKYPVKVNTAVMKSIKP